MLSVQVAHGLGQVLARQLVLLRHLADEQAGVHGVLVAHVVAGQVAVTLLEAEDEAVCLARVGQLGDDVADVLEARQATAQLEAVFRSQRIDHGRRHDGGHGHLARQVLAALGAHAAHVVE